MILFVEILIAVKKPGKDFSDCFNKYSNNNQMNNKFCMKKLKRSIHIIDLQYPFTFP